MAAAVTAAMVNAATTKPASWRSPLLRPVALGLPRTLAVATGWRNLEGARGGVVPPACGGAARRRGPTQRGVTAAGSVTSQGRGLQINAGDGEVTISAVDGSAVVPRHRDPDGDRGPGLAIIGAVCHAWGVDSLDDGGKHIWVRLVRPPVPPGE